MKAEFTSYKGSIRIERMLNPVQIQPQFFFNVNEEEGASQKQVHTPFIYFPAKEIIRHAGFSRARKSIVHLTRAKSSNDSSQTMN